MMRKLIEASLIFGLSLTVAVLVMVMIFPVHPYGRTPVSAAPGDVVHAVSVELSGSAPYRTGGGGTCPWLAAQAPMSVCPRSRANSGRTACPWMQQFDGRSAETKAEKGLTRGLLLASSSHGNPPAEAATQS